jgi:hypothetical protein
MLAAFDVAVEGNGAVEWLEFFLRNHWWSLGVALAVSIASLLALPSVVVALPCDYFMPCRRRRVLHKGAYPLLGYTILLLKNLFGIVLLFLGGLMLVLPGQGLLTLLAGLVVMDFPGKYRLLRWMVNRGKVLDALNWLRAKGGEAPLLRPPRVKAPHP